MKKILMVLVLLSTLALAGLDYGKIAKVENYMTFTKDKSLKDYDLSDSYSDLKRDKDKIGGIWLMKGRTQIVFIKERLEKNGIKIDKSHKYHVICEKQLRGR